MIGRGYEVLYRPVLLSSIAAILLGSGIAALIACLPSEADGANSEAQESNSLTDVNARVRARCPECGVVTATRRVDAGTEHDPAGAATSVDRGNIQEKAIGRYEVTVHMMDGSSRMFVDSSATNWRLGERMIVIEGGSAIPK